MPRRRFASALPPVIGCVFGLLMMTACNDNGGGPSPSTAPATPAVNATVAPGLPTTVNDLPQMHVDQFHALLGELKGTPVVVNVWAAWCGPCVDEAPLLVAAAKAHPGVQFLGVDVLDDRTGALKFLSKFGVTYPSIFDPAGAIKVDLGAFGQPDTYFYDASGRQVEAIPAIVSAASLNAGLAKIAPSS
jgi:thiol-disulfide isomerase/thioredoxin